MTIQMIAIEQCFSVARFIAAVQGCSNVYGLRKES